MDELRKITIHPPVGDLAMAQELTRQGITETVRIALRRLASIRAQQRLRALRGTVKFSMTLDELRHDRE